jgi:SAM-dependent methyltransferase
LNPQFKNILHSLGIYHPLQSHYRNFVFHIKRLFFKISFFSYKGHGFTCNVCQQQYFIFVDDWPAAENKNALSINNVIAGYGKNIICPNCLSNARERLVIAMLEHHVNIDNKKILHLSPEKYVYQFIKSKSQVVTADLVPGFYKSIDKHIRQEDVTALSFADHSFDLVVANHILEHIPDDLKAMSEINRVLKKGGIAILQVPYSETISETIEEPLIDNPKKQSNLFGQKDHVRIYQLNDYISRLGQSGFIVSKISYKELSAFHQHVIQLDEIFLDIKKPY